MLDKIMNAVLDSALFVATGIPKVNKNNKFDRGMLEIIIVLTNTSLHFYKTTFWGKPKELLFKIPLENIKEIKSKPTKVFLDFTIHYFDFIKW